MGTKKRGKGCRASYLIVNVKALFVVLASYLIVNVKALFVIFSNMSTQLS